VAASIVCCVDESAESYDAARIGRALADRLEMELVLLHIAPPPIQPGVGAAPAGQERLVEAEREDAGELLARAVRELGLAATTRCRVEFGDAAERVLAVCEEEHAEMVVLGSHGRGGLKAALLGSVSRDVAGKAPCIVVVVPPGAAEQSMLS
jgi:nucleotide-binding universal stress UspA family protein